MRATWSGALSWGMVVLPVKLGAATTDNSVSFRMIHRDCGGLVKMPKTCSGCGEIVPPYDLAKGFQHSADNITVLTDADLADLPLPTAKTISVEKFVPAGEIDELSRSHAYFMWPDGAPGTPAYALLRDAMAETGKVAICKIAMRSRERLAVLSVRGNSLMLTTLLWADEVREPDWEVPGSTLPPESRDMALSLIGQSSGHFAPGDYRDGYRAALEALIEEIASGEKQPAAAGTATVKPAALDLNAALKASLKPAAPKTRKRAAAKQPAKTRKAAA